MSERSDLAEDWGARLERLVLFVERSLRMSAQKVAQRVIGGVEMLVRSKLGKSLSN